MEGKQKTQEAQEENDEERIVSWLAIGESLEFSSSVCDEAVRYRYYILRYWKMCLHIVCTWLYRCRSSLSKPAESRNRAKFWGLSHHMLLWSSDERPKQQEATIPAGIYTYHITFVSATCDLQLQGNHWSWRLIRFLISLGRIVYLILLFLCVHIRWMILGQSNNLW